MGELPDVKPGQVWADAYPIHAGRTLRVESIDGDKAVCVVLTNTDRVQETLDTGNGYDRDMRGSRTRIAIRRMRRIDAQHGYRLIAHSTLGGATCPGSCDVERCPRCGWINPAAWEPAGQSSATRERR